MDNDIEERMLGAIELFHYAQRFKRQIFTLVVEDAPDLHDLLPDLRVIYAAGIMTVIFCRHAEEAQRVVEKWNQCGYYFEPLPVGRGEFSSPQLKNLILALLQKDTAPVVFLKDSGSSELNIADFYRAALAQAAAMQASKVFFPIDDAGLIVNGRFYSCPSHAEVERFLTEKAQINIGAELLELLHQAQAAHGIDIVLHAASEGVLFSEIFTHEGAGTLLSDTYQSGFRAARKTDVRDIYQLMQPYIRTGTMLPVGEESILDQIDDWYVYTINEQVVATARLAPFGEAVELGKLCTLPRFRGKGRATELIELLVKIAAEKKYRFVFALTKNGRTAELFRSLGFKEVERDTLPAQWKADYDFSRPSRAFRYELSAA